MVAQSDIAIREVTREDSDALGELLASPDTGRIQFAPRYHVDAYEAMVELERDVEGAVAVWQASGAVIGCGFVRYSHIQYEGMLREYAWLHGLRVHRDYRRRGVATRLAQWRVRRARERVGDDGIIGANIQQGNEGSLQVAQSWQKYVAGELVSGVVGVRQKALKPLTGVTVRRAEPKEYGRVARGMNSFYEDYNFYAPETDESLAEWLAVTPFDDAMRHYFVAVGGKGSILAGMGIVEGHRVMELEVKRMPGPLRLLNHVVKLVPPDGRMRQLMAVKPWFAPGRLAEARYLWETLRWHWRDRGATLAFTYDEHSPLKQVFRTPLWMPKTAFTVAVDAPAAPSRLCYAG